MLSEQEKQFYRNLYKLLANEEINSTLVKYAEMQYNKALNTIRVRKDSVYDYGYGNGNADAWQAIVNLKDHVTKIMREI